MIEGIVLTTYPSGDKDLVARVLTVEYGKVSVFARRNRSGGKGSIRVEPLDRGVIDFGPRKGDLHTLRSFRPLSSYPAVRASLLKLSIALFLLDATDALLPEESGSDDSLYPLLEVSLSELDKEPSEKTTLRLCYNTLEELLTLCGYIEKGMFGSPSLNALRKLIHHLEHCTEKRLRSKGALEESLQFFIQKQQAQQ